MNHKDMTSLFASARPLRREQYDDCSIAIGDTLRAFYESASRQALPERFDHLLEKLEAAEAAAESDDTL